MNSHNLILALLFKPVHLHFYQSRQCFPAWLFTIRSWNIRHPSTTAPRRLAVFLFSRCRRLQPIEKRVIDTSIKSITGGSRQPASLDGGKEHIWLSVTQSYSSYFFPTSWANPVLCLRTWKGFVDAKYQQFLTFASSWCCMQSVRDCINNYIYLICEMNVTK